MNILEVFFNVFKNLVSLLVDAINAINESIKTVLNLIKDFLNIFKDLINAIANVPIIGSIFSPILVPAIAILNICIQIIDAILTVLGLITSLCNWVKDNLDITTYLIILFGLAILTTFPVVGTLISKLPTPALILLFLVPLLPAIIYIVQVYVQNKDRTVALEYTKYIVFNAIPFMVANFDVVVYFLLIGFEFTLLQDPTLYDTLREALPRVLFFNLLVVVLGITFLPILFFAYYYLVYKVTAIMDTLQKVRQNVIRVCLDNLDIGLYALFILNVFLIITDEATQEGLKELLPEFLYMNLNIILVSLAAMPVAIMLYFSLTRGISFFDAVGNVRDLIYSIGNNISSAFVRIFNIKPIVFNVQSDPNPGLKPAERVFFARLFGDDLTRAPYNDPLKYPFYQNLNSTANPRLLYSELNAEFYGDANYQKDLYPDYFDQGEKATLKMTRATYIAIPFLQLSSPSAIMSKLDKVIFRCFGMNPAMPIDKTNPNKIISSISDISDATIRSYATGQNYIDPNIWKGLLRDRALFDSSINNGAVLKVTQLLIDGYSAQRNNVYYSDIWLQQFCLQIKGNVPLNLYQMAYAATGANYSQATNPVYQALYKLLTTELTINNQPLSQNPIAFWNYGYAAAQQANISSFITNTTYDVSAEFKSKLDVASTSGIISYFLSGNAQLPTTNTAIDPTVWLKQLYKTITGNEVPENVSIWELGYKSFQSNDAFIQNLHTTLNSLRSNSSVYGCPDPQLCYSYLRNATKVSYLVNDLSQSLINYTFDISSFVSIEGQGLQMITRKYKRFLYTLHNAASDSGWAQLNSLLNVWIHSKIPRTGPMPFNTGYNNPVLLTPQPDLSSTISYFANYNRYYRNDSGTGVWTSQIINTFGSNAYNYLLYKARSLPIASIPNDKKNDVISILYNYNTSRITQASWSSYIQSFMWTSAFVYDHMVYYYQDNWATTLQSNLQEYLTIQFNTFNYFGDATKIQNAALGLTFQTVLDSALYVSNYNEDTLDSNNIIICPNALYDMYQFQCDTPKANGSKFYGWAYFGYQSAYNISYFNIILDLMTSIGYQDKLSNKLNWQSTWPYQFAKQFNKTIDYDSILQTSVNDLLAQTDTTWFNNFYKLATGNAESLDQEHINMMLYNTANTFLSNSGGTGPSTSGDTVTNPLVFFREDMPDSWAKIFVGDSNWSLRGKCQAAFTNMVSAVLGDQQNKSPWIYELFSLIGDNLPASVAQTYKDIFYNQFATGLYRNRDLGGDDNWLAKFYNALIPNKVRFDMSGNLKKDTNSWYELMGDILFYGLQAAQIALNSDLRTTYKANKTINPIGSVTLPPSIFIDITVDWGPYIFINPTDLANYRNSNTSAISYQAPDGGLVPQGSPWPWFKKADNTFDKTAYKGLWPNLVSNNIVLEPPTTDDSGNDITQPSNGKYNSLYISYCNACFIQNSIAEFKVQLALSGNAYAQSVERFNLYAYHAGVAPNPLDPNSVISVTNPDFAMTLIQLKNYVYTFASGTKNVVMFNDFLRYSVLPTSYISAQANFADGLNSIFDQEIILLEKGNSPTSSSNIFSVADIVLELVANGVKLNNILGLYNNLRKANIEFLCRSMSTNGTINPGSTISQSQIISVNDNLQFTNTANTSGLYSSSKLAGLDKLDGEAQVATVLSAFTQSIRQQNIEQAVQDSPGQNGMTADGKIKDYGGPYIRRLFYDAAGVLNSIYTDLFTILQKNVCHKGSNYIPSANDPLDMIWFRYDVQNWQNPFNGLKYGDQKYNPKTNKSDGFNSYICGGYRDGNIHNKSIQNVLRALDAQIVSTGGAGIYNRLFSLLDYIASYNNIISKIYTSQQLGPNAVNMLNQLKNNLSNKYLRLDQNNKYMDLISLCAGNYQHFHVNLPLDVPVYLINDGGKSLQENIAKMSISSVADLGGWLSKNMSYDPLYPQFKDEITTAFIFKTIWDLIWWPQFCYEYYYRNPQNNLPSLVHRFNTSMSDTINPANCIANGKLLKGFSMISKTLGDTRTKSQYFSPNDNNLSTFDISALPNIANLLLGQNAQIIWKSMCYSYQHDAMLGYVFFTSTISGRPSTGYSSINISQTPADKQDYYTCTSASYVNGYGNNLINDSDNSTMMTPYSWLSMNTSIGGTSLPTQITAVTNSPGAANAPSLALYTKFGYACSDISRREIRAQFFADPMSWIDSDRAYQIYPLTFGIYPGNVTNYNSAYPAWVYQGISPLKTNWQFSSNGYTDVLYKIADPSKLSILNSISTQAYAPMIDIALVSGL